ncbi:MAG: hypothetical protein ACR2IE_07605 [Candidatus Sumerlaeaceae bacterium]
MISDVQSWVAAPASNVGWLLRGNESTVATAVRFESHESTSVALRPLVTVTYLSTTLASDWQLY